MSSQRAHDEAALGASLVPRVTVRPEADLVEQADGLFLYCNLPGVAEEDLQLTVDGKNLRLRARTSMGPMPCGRVHALEFDETVYEASFSLPEQVDKKRIEASLQVGVLTVFLPFPRREGPRRILVNQG